MKEFWPMGDKSENREEARQWLAFAAEDLDYGCFGFTRFPRAAAWSFQQAAEKALKACLICKGRVPPRTHDLVLLRNSLENNVDPQVEEAVLKLAEISASSRYPDDAEVINVQLAQEYERAAATIVSWAHGQLEA